jgi:hypothetical protein
MGACHNRCRPMVVPRGLVASRDVLFPKTGWWLALEQMPDVPTTCTVGQSTNGRVEPNREDIDIEGASPCVVARGGGPHKWTRLRASVHVLSTRALH